MGRRRRQSWGSVFVVLAVAGGLLWLAARPEAAGMLSAITGEDAPPAPDVAVTEITSIPARPADAFPMTVRHVFDGDTVELQHSAPNDVVTTTAPIRVRLIGIDTPEGTPTVECWADEARSHLAALAPEGATVWVGLDRETWDHYERRLFYLWADDGRFVNYELVAAGDAEALRVWPNEAHYPLFVSAQAAAQAAGAGQWSAC
ncbi:MAG TPA: thermonuclease family protein [Microbacterium sp.]|uniref:thermonuclease family protein n=1 Tax=Microbacterium sp. TaxID=51671 RepID=UPI002B67C900|nr:thermonuclease family protein [Microbacterium sp.]HWI31546.1 thermonuclease family protein [Microbacterium sp.]